MKINGEIIYTHKNNPNKKAYIVKINNHRSHAIKSPKRKTLKI